MVEGAWTGELSNRGIGEQYPAIGTLKKGSNTDANSVRLSALCELCANISESPVQNRSNQSTFRRKISNESRRFKRFLKTLDGDPGGQSDRVVVDRDFITNDSNVRQGAHALISRSPAGAQSAPGSKAR